MGGTAQRRRTWPRVRRRATRKPGSPRRRSRRPSPPIPRPRAAAGCRAADGRVLRPPPPALEAGGDPEAPSARRQGHVAEGGRQGIDPNRGVGEGARETGRAEDQQAAVEAALTSDLLPGEGRDPVLPTVPLDPGLRRGAKAFT